MLSQLRRPDGTPTLRVRVAAALVIIGMAVLAAPALIPVLLWLVHLVV